jgi:hypothetical protein
MAGVENPLSADQVEPLDGGAGPLLLGDVEAALAALHGSGKATVRAASCAFSRFEDSEH